MRHSPEDHLVEQILGLGKRLVAGFTLAPSVRQVGEIDDETAFFGRDQIDRPCRWAGYLFHPSLLSQVADRQAELPQDAVQQAGLQFAAAGRDMGDAIATFDADMAALTAARNDSDIATPAQSPKQFIGRHPDRSTDLPINRRPEISH